LLFQSLDVFIRRVKDDVAACDEGLDVQQTQRFKQLAQMVHLDSMAADVDRSEKCDESRR